MVLHRHGCDGGRTGQLGAGLLFVLLLPHGPADLRSVCVQRLSDCQPVPDAPQPDDAARIGGVDGEEEAAEPGMVWTWRRRDGPPGAAGPHHCHLCGLLTSAHCKLTFNFPFVLSYLCKTLTFQHFHSLSLFASLLQHV